MPKQKSDREQYQIRIGETLVPVNREIYGAYYGGERRERYQAERDQAHETLYFSAMGEEGADVLEILPAWERTLWTPWSAGKETFSSLRPCTAFRDPTGR